jgi:hypothetical protein
MKTMLLSALLVATTAAHGQEAQAPRKITYTTEADIAGGAEQKRKDEAANERAFHEYPVGKTFWMLPREKPYMGLPFHTTLKENYMGAQLEGDFKADVTVSFKVTELLAYPSKSTGIAYVYRVVLEDGTEAYMYDSRFGRYSPGKRADDRSAYIGAKPEHALPTNTDYELYAEDPAKLLLAYQAEEQRMGEQEEAQRQADIVTQRKSNARALLERKRKGGVKLGMTAAQARASSWGAPQSVNRSTGSYGVHEQWVYGGGNYLYFEDGVLTSIQN